MELSLFPFKLDRKFVGIPFHPLNKTEVSSRCAVLIVFIFLDHFYSSHFIWSVSILALLQKLVLYIIRTINYLQERSNPIIITDHLTVSFLLLLSYCWMSSHRPIRWIITKLHSFPEYRSTSYNISYNKIEIYSIKKYFFKCYTKIWNGYI